MRYVMKQDFKVGTISLRLGEAVYIIEEPVDSHYQVNPRDLEHPCYLVSVVGGAQAIIPRSVVDKSPSFYRPDLHVYKDWEGLVHVVSQPSTPEAYRHVLSQEECKGLLEVLR